MKTLRQFALPALLLAALATQAATVIIKGARLDLIRYTDGHAPPSPHPSCRFAAAPGPAVGA